MTTPHIHKRYLLTHLDDAELLLKSATSVLDESAEPDCVIYLEILKATRRIVKARRLANKLLEDA